MFRKRLVKHGGLSCCMLVFDMSYLLICARNLASHGGLVSMFCSLFLFENRLHCLGSSFFFSGTAMFLKWLGLQENLLKVAWPPDDPFKQQLCRLFEGSKEPGSQLRFLCFCSALRLEGWLLGRIQLGPKLTSGDSAHLASPFGSHGQIAQIWRFSPHVKPSTMQSFMENMKRLLMTCFFCKPSVFDQTLLDGYMKPQLLTNHHWGLRKIFLYFLP